LVVVGDEEEVPTTQGREFYTQAAKAKGVAGLVVFVVVQDEIHWHLFLQCVLANVTVEKAPRKHCQFVVIFLAVSDKIETYYLCMEVSRLPISCRRCFVACHYIGVLFDCVAKIPCGGQDCNGWKGWSSEGGFLGRSPGVCGIASKLPLASFENSNCWSWSCEATSGEIVEEEEATSVEV
jgi:hypothetical protein